MTRILAAGASTEGRVRKTNEDGYRLYFEAPAIEQKGRGFVFAVADGIGSYRAGAQAAWIAVDQLALYYQLPDSQWNPDSTVKDLIFRANAAITNLRTTQKEYYGMGTTLVVLHVHAGCDRATVYSAGDSMVYIRRGEQLAAVTRPQQSAQGELSNHMGLGDSFGLEKVNLGLLPEDVLLLCSDGLSGFLSNEEILEGLSLSSDPQHCVDHLVALGVEKGDDNVTGVVVRLAP